LTRKDEAENDLTIRLIRTSELYKTIRTGIWGAVVVVLIIFGYLSVDRLAGKSTVFNSVVDWALRLTTSEAIAWAIALVCGGGYLIQKKARRRAAENMGPRLAELERRVDPNRTSSGLDKAGDNLPGDQL
jgi:hypothetical protein